MKRAFRAFLRKRYESDAALQRAWGRPSARLGKAEPPTKAEWRDALENWMHWPDPAKTKRYRDYFACVRELFFRRVRRLTSAVEEAADRPVLCAYDGLKQPMMGWLLKDAFGGAGRGMNYPNILLASGSYDVAPLLDHGALDALITPADYTARSVGFGFEPEGLSDSLVLRGKTTLVEDDARSWVSGGDTQGAWRSVAEARAGLWRNTAVAMSRGLFNYWMNVGGGFFEDERLMKLIERQVPRRRRLQKQPLARTEHAIALILDDTSPLWEDFTSGFQHLAVLRQRVHELALTGLPYRVHLLSDLRREDFPQYRAYLFPNLFKLTEERVELIRRKCIRDGSVAIFGPGTGITDGEKRTARLASKLLGFDLELVPKEVARRVLVEPGAHPALAGIEAPFSYGDSYVYGPLLRPAQELGQATELGRGSTFFQSNRAGLVVRSFGKGARGPRPKADLGAGDGAAVFSVATPLPARLLRALARYGGCNAWSALGDVVAASESMVAVHSTRPGERRIRLPQPRRVVDLQKDAAPDGAVRSFSVELDAPATRLFLLERPKKEAAATRPASTKSASPGGS